MRSLSYKYESQLDSEKLVRGTDKTRKIVKLGMAKTFLTLMKTFLGTGLLLMAKGFANGGYLFSIVLLVIIGLITGYAAQGLIETRSKVRGSFSEIAGLSFGTWGRVVSDIILVISQFTFIIAFVDFVCLNIQQQIAAWTKSDGASIWWYGLGCLVVFTPLVMVRKYEKFAIFHIFGDLMVVCAIVTTVAYSSITISRDGLHSQTLLFNNNGYFLFFGSAIFAYSAAGVVIPIYESMEKPQYFLCLWWAGIIVCFVVYVAMGILPYFAFGEVGINQPFITQVVQINYPNYWTQILSILYSLSIVPSYIINIQPIYHVLQVAILKGRVPETTRSALRTWLKNLIRFIIVIISVVLGLLSGNSLDYVLGIISTISVTPIVFIFPAAFHLKNMPQTQCRRGLNWFVIVFGFVVIVVNVVLTLIN